MSLLADALQPHLLPSAFSLTGPVQQLTLPDVLLSKTVGYVLSVDAQTTSISVDFRDEVLLAEATASDFNRLATAAFQSALFAWNGMSEKESLAWSLIKLYYAAFYSGHALLRLLGLGYCYLDGRYTSRLIGVANAQGVEIPFSLQSGMYRCHIESKGRSLICTRSNGASTGGSHDQFWIFLDDVLNELSEKVLRGALVSSEAQSVAAKIQSLRRLLAYRSTAGWLSKMRNEVQYRHIHDVWHPCSVIKRDRGAMERLAAHWTADPMALDLDAEPAGVLGRFVVACAFLVGASRVLSLRVAERSSDRRRAFVNYGPLPYLRTALKGMNR